MFYCIFYVRDVQNCKGHPTLPTLFLPLNNFLVQKLWHARFTIIYLSLRILLSLLFYVGKCCSFMYFADSPLFMYILSSGSCCPNVDRLIFWLVKIHSARSACMTSFLVTSALNVNLDSCFSSQIRIFSIFSNQNVASTVKVTNRDGN